LIYIGLNKTQDKREELYLIHARVVTDITVRIVIRNVIGRVAVVVGVVVTGCGIAR
jgi:hypothetical protein